MLISFIQNLCCQWCEHRMCCASNSRDVVFHNVSTAADDAEAHCSASCALPTLFGVAVGGWGKRQAIHDGREGSRKALAVRQNSLMLVEVESTGGTSSLASSVTSLFWDLQDRYRRLLGLAADRLNRIMGNGQFFGSGRSDRRRITRHRDRSWFWTRRRNMNEAGEAMGSSGRGTKASSAEAHPITRFMQVERVCCCDRQAGSLRGIVREKEPGVKLTLSSNLKMFAFDSLAC